MKRLTIANWLAAFCALVIMSGVFGLAPQAWAASSPRIGAVQQAAPTPAPTATAANSVRRDRIEAPQLRPQAAALLIGANLLVALAVVVLAWFLRRRGLRRRA